jgi:hypothetical protein
VADAFGEGSSSLIGMMSEIGPCVPVPASKESITTIPREVGLHRVYHVRMRELS